MVLREMLARAALVFKWRWPYLLPRGTGKCISGCSSDLVVLLALVSGARGSRHPAVGTTVPHEHELPPPKTGSALLETHA